METVKYLNDSVRKIKELMNKENSTYPFSEIGSHEISSPQQLMLQKSNGVVDFFKDVIMQVKLGNLDAAFAALQLKQIEKISKSSNKKIEEDAIEALSKEDKKGFIYGDHQLQFREGSRSVDYTQVKEIQKLEEELKQVKEKYKKALIGIELNSTVLHSERQWIPNGGETLDLSSWKYNKSSLVFSKKK